MKKRTNIGICPIYNKPIKLLPKGKNIFVQTYNIHSRLAKGKTDTIINKLFTNNTYSRLTKGKNDCTHSTHLVKTLLSATLAFQE